MAITEDKSRNRWQILKFSSVQLTRSVLSNSLRSHEPQHTRPPCPSPTPGVYPNSCPLSVMPSNHLTLCHPLLLLLSVFPSIRVFSNESALHIRWPKYCSFSFSISPSSEYPGLISFRMDWLDLPAVQGTYYFVIKFICIIFFFLDSACKWYHIIFVFVWLHLVW